jgi:hypothetical protein
MSGYQSLTHSHDQILLQHNRCARIVGVTPSPIAVLARIDSQHVGDALFCFDFIEETITAVTFLKVSV